MSSEFNGIILAVVLVFIAGFVDFIHYQYVMFISVVQMKLTLQSINLIIIILLPLSQFIWCNKSSSSIILHWA